jgi:hypothetical protein
MSLLPIYLVVPEAWRYDGQAITIYQLVGDHYSLTGLQENKIPIQIFQNQWGGSAAPLILVLYLVFY